MKSINLLSGFMFTVACLFFSGCNTVASDTNSSDASMAYHFDQPASVWEETFPLGNGRIGMMPDGGTEKETYVLNEISMWSGSKQDTDNPEARKSLPEIRRLLFAGKNDEAQALMYKTFVCKGEGSGRGHGYAKPYGAYQLFGNLVIDYLYPEEGPATGIADYRRELQLDNALATVSYKRGNITYHRESFTSFASDLGVIRLTADKAKSLNFAIGMNRKSNVPDPRFDTGCSVSDGENLYLLFSGRLLSGTEGEDNMEPQGMHYKAQVCVLLPEGGTLKAGGDGESLAVDGASEAIILIGMVTDYFDKDPEAQLKSQFAAVEGKSYSAMKKEHTDAYRELFARASVDFGHVEEKEQMPVNKRLELFQQDKNDPSLLALYYQFGRYLLISSTRPGLLPPNLQGLWCNTINTPWNGDYHLNINLQMNLWPAETGNLPELHLPLAEWTKQQVESGRGTAKAFYDARGWVTHILGNVWEFTAPGEHPSWGATNTSAAWLCEHLYQHYQFTLDKEYLADVYPVMKEAALFFVDMLVEDPRNNYLVTAPTTSPENAFVMPDDKRVSICAGSTMDNQILRELFTNTIEAASILGLDMDFADTLAQKRARLMPTTVGEDGRIMEWLEPFTEAEPTHRHVSHLYGLYPSNEISVASTPELAEAARKSLIARGDQSTGWSMGWKVNFWARLHDGEHAFKLLADLLRPCMQKGVNMSNGGGTYPNLFCAHPPFQIDGNFGGAAGIAEMLIQSQNGFIELLPALPVAWNTGHFEGLCVQGGGEVSASWTDGVLQIVTLKAKTDHSFRLKLPLEMQTASARLNHASVDLTFAKGMFFVEMKKDDTLIIEKK
ncbi:MAG: glycoside hydrolase family 95 protein [Tannerella sp.]|jgi:alpha-L-fucosidase 2|nr:glycoside hydrolase family 95 protein [Tannerella sp.]